MLSRHIKITIPVTAGGLLPPGELVGYVTLLFICQVTVANPTTVTIRPIDVMILPAYQLKGGPEDDNTFPASSIVILPKGEKI